MSPCWPIELSVPGNQIQSTSGWHSFQIRPSSECAHGAGFPKTIQSNIHTQGMVGNNVGKTAIAGQKVPDPNYCKQVTIWLHNLWKF